MPMNAPPEYYAMLEKVEEANTPEDKIKYLLEAYKLLPKHKGTENERKLLTQRIAKLRRLIESKKKSAKRQEPLIKKEGEFQIVLFGFPNVGKSTFLKEITGKDIKIAPYPYTTNKPEVASMDYKGAKVQIVELPGFKDNYEGEYVNILYGSDVIGLCIDFDLDPYYQYETLKKFLNSKKIYYGEREQKLNIEKNYSNTIEIRGESLLEISKSELVDLLNAYGIRGAIVTIYQRCDLEDVLEVLERAQRKQWIIIATKGEPYDFGIDLPIYKYDKSNPEKSKKELISKCGFIEVYLKPPKKEVSPTPVLIKKGTTAEELGEEILHKKPKQIKLVNKNNILVSGDYTINDKDIFEFR